MPTEKQKEDEFPIIKPPTGDVSPLQRYKSKGKPQYKPPGVPDPERLKEMGQFDPYEEEIPGDPTDTSEGFADYLEQNPEASYEDYTKWSREHGTAPAPAAPAPSGASDIEGLSAKMDIPDIGETKPHMPTDFSWGNITEVWKAIEHSRQTREPKEWEEVCQAVAQGLKNWRAKETKWADKLKKLQLIKVLVDRTPEGELRQKRLDAYEREIESFPWRMQKAARQGRTIAPVRVRTIDELTRSLEGVKQGDFEAYHPSVKSAIRNFQLNREQEQHGHRRKMKQLLERLHGIKDPVRRAPLERALKTIGEKLQSPNIDEVEGKILSREADALIRRLEGAQTDAGKAKIEKNIASLKEEIKTPEELRHEQLKYSEGLKYDALLWIVTNVAHPIKATPAPVAGGSRGPAQEARPVGPMPYMPPGSKPYGKEGSKPLGGIWDVPREPLKPAREGGKPAAGEHWKPYRKQVRPRDVDRPGIGGQKVYPPKADECRIFLSLIHEGKYNQAKKFIENPYVVDEGSLVVLENIADMPELNGLKGRVRTFSEESGRSVVVDLFKNNVVTDSAIMVALYEARPYLQ